MVEKKVWAEPDFNLACLGGLKNPHSGKKKYGPNQTSTQPILVDRKIHTVEKKVWAEPDFDSAYFGGSKNPHGGKKSMGQNQTSTRPILVDRKKKTRYKASGNITECEILVYHRTCFQWWKLPKPLKYHQR